jgi:hypothetical protein
MLDVVGIPVREAEADPPLVVDADRALPRALALESVEAIAGRDLQVVEPGGQVDVLELASGATSDVRAGGARQCP